MELYAVGSLGLDAARVESRRCQFSGFSVLSPEPGALHSVSCHLSGESSVQWEPGSVTSTWAAFSGRGTFYVDAVDALRAATIYVARQCLALHDPEFTVEVVREPELSLTLHDPEFRIPLRWSEALSA